MFTFVSTVVGDAFLDHLQYYNINLVSFFRFANKYDIKSSIIHISRFKFSTFLEHSKWRKEEQGGEVNVVGGGKGKGSRGRQWERGGVGESSLRSHASSLPPQFGRLAGHYESSSMMGQKNKGGGGSNYEELAIGRAVT
ncbi:hypothetical protein L6452_08403 [Arctium lappa]|uniref:Uncharacterized protein n=1 Tax=Arctium lappa TaxID=4217 RepID=A0ACB9DH46_ARCLA|nr:hypothetical protein L6452_08403 [Arctium lappa]